MFMDQKTMLSRWPCYPNWSTESKQFLSKFGLLFFSSRNWQAESKLCMERQGIQKTQNNFEKKSKIEKLILSHFKTYHKSMVIKTVWYWHRIDIENPEINPCIYDQLIFDRNAKFNVETSLLTNTAGSTEYSCAKEYIWTPTSHHP